MDGAWHCRAVPRLPTARPAARALPCPALRQSSCAVPVCRPVLAPAAKRGFTLIEILVALALVGIVLGLAMVRFDLSDGQTMERESQRLALLFESARDEAIAGGRAIAWSSDGSGYQFWTLDDRNVWQALPSHEVLKPRELPPGMRVLAIRVNLKARRVGERIVFEPSGVNQPFDVTLGLGERRWHLAGDIMGRVQARADPA
ncbi:GspH/FimT family pseudopilin [Chitiniphilus purpureus]|uniref:Type II secretion system protein H n=1 Tax=Chitiniphilus purpureus TaxID=2981137 RepID=A0ABY6DJ39_9NEIS|nr:GspH/FimT family pseudopilin [Chitiniphilus sp. CD1]UXY14362.1 GspH/FimT family pseudopilin [Chitiniphilus sp. CD1]